MFVHTLLTLQCTFIKEIAQIEESVSRGQVLNETLRDRKATDYNCVLSDVLCSWLSSAFIWNVRTVLMGGNPLKTRASVQDQTFLSSPCWQRSPLLLLPPPSEAGKSSLEIPEKEDRATFCTVIC